MLENSSSNLDVQYSPSRKTKFLLMGLLLILNIIIRIPSIPHEKGYDSFFIHVLSNSVSTFGEARWWINWLSVFGFYPDSYASAVPFTLSGISQVIGIEMEKAILLYCIFMGLFGMFTAYVFAGHIYNDFLFKYIMSLIFSLAPGLMLFTTWEVSTRGQFIVFLPLFLYILLKEEFKIKKYILLATCFILIFSTHHYAFFLLPISAIYVFLKIIQKVKPAFLEIKYLNYVFICLFIIALIYPFFSGTFIEAGSRYTWVLDALKTNVRQIGPLALLLPGGFAYLFLNKKKFEAIFMCLSVILLAPIFYSQTYGPFILVFICVFLISIAFNNFLKSFINHNNKLLMSCAVLMILSFVLFSNFYNHYRTGQSESYWYMEESTYTSGKWAKNHIPENAHGLDSGFETLRVFATSEGHPITVSLDPANLAYGLINASTIEVTSNSPLSSAYYFDGPYVLVGNTLESQTEWLRLSGYKQDLAKFDYVVQDRYDNKKIFDYLRSEFNLICDGPRIEIWKNTK